MGAALFSRLAELGWARRLSGTRIVQFTPAGLTGFRAAFGVEPYPTDCGLAASQQN